MRGFIVGTIVTAIAFAILVRVVPNFTYAGEPIGLVVIALIAGVVNGLIKPVVKLLALPIRMMTLGLVGFLINAGMLLLIAWLSDKVGGVDFAIAGFPPKLSFEAVGWAVVGSIVLSVISAVIGRVIPD